MLLDAIKHKKHTAKDLKFDVVSHSYLQHSQLLPLPTLVVVVVVDLGVVLAVLDLEQVTHMRLPPVEVELH
jgi:hypothetical protein